MPQRHSFYDVYCKECSDFLNIVTEKCNFSSELVMVCVGMNFHSNHIISLRFRTFEISLMMEISGTSEYSTRGVKN